MFALTRNAREQVTTMSYSAYDQTKSAWIENFDVGADGSLDYRTTTINDRIVKREFLVGDQWLELVQRDGRSGVVFNGRFTAVSEALKIAKSNQSGR